MARQLLFAAGIFGFVGVALGAFGAHGIEDWLQSQPDGAKRLAWWKTGVRYHMWHTGLLGIFALAAFKEEVSSFRWGAYATQAGILIFSGTLYIMTLTDIRWLGAITPLGGTLFLVAWMLLAVGARKLKAQS
jgi:uncharacterized membrane protein YgdD (TMEM256/DUF423 family)